jgi:uncharacterized protein (DUF2252 family)
MTVSERAAVGRAARSRASRSSHGEWEPSAGREDPIAVLEAQAESRVAGLVPIRHGRMGASPFAFFRGAAAVMAADLAVTAASGLRVQACGDAHLSNFGVFAAPDRRLVFDLNDFDETLPGPWEWDVKRLAASFEIAARENGLKRKQRDAVLLALASRYRKSMRGFSGQRNLEIWYARLDEEAIRAQLQAADGRVARRAEKGAAKARAKDSLRALDRLTHRVDGELRIVSRPPLIVPLEDLIPGEGRAEVEAMLRGVIERYAETLKDDRRRLLESYSFRHIAHKVVGVGSVGTRAWIVLMTGRDDRDPLFLQAKEAQASVLEPYAGASSFDSHGQRVVEGQWLMQAASDSFLGWCPAVEGIDGRRRDFYVRQLWDGKGSSEVEAMGPAALRIYAQLCGWTLARAHARSGDPVAIGAYLGSGKVFDEAIAEFSRRYADQNERDFDALRAAIDSGRLDAEDA